MSHSETAAGHDVPSNPAVQATVRSEYLQSTVDALCALVSECRLEFGPEGLSASAADPASGQAVELSLDAETRRLHVVVDELSYTLGLVDPEAVREPPELDEGAFTHTARAVVAGREIDRFVGAAAMVADHLALGIDESEAALYVNAEGDTDHVSLRLSEAELAELDAGDAHSLFSLDYLRDMAKPMPADASVTLRLGTEMPVRFGFETADGAGSVEYLLSPRLVRS